MPKILLAVSGMSPQIITETLYALHQEQAWLPDEIHLITTLQGKLKAEQQLLGPKGHFHCWCADYSIAVKPRFDLSSIHLITDPFGNALADLRTPQDNEYAANTICNLIKTLTLEEDNELHVSLAGGRKTMGFYVGYALSLFGRAQDRLSHVLVSEHFESNPEFFYPTPAAKLLTLTNGSQINAQKAKVWLAEIPFVRLRAGLPAGLLYGQHGFSETINLARLATETLELVLYPQQRQYSVNGICAVLPPVQFLLLLWCATRGQVVPPLVEGEYSPIYSQELWHLADKHHLPLHSKTEQLLQKGEVNKSFLETNVSKLNKQLLTDLGPELGRHCKLAMRTQRSISGYALANHLLITVMS